MIDNKLILFFQTISAYSILLPLLLGVIKYRTFNQNLKILIIYISISCLAEISSRYLSALSINNLFIYYIFSFIEFSLFCIIYFDLLKITHQKKLLILIVSLFAITSLIDLFYISGYLRMNELARNIESVALMIFAILYFRHLISQPAYQNLLKLFGFWFNTAIIIYFSGSFFIFLFSNYMLKNDPDSFFAIYTIHSLLNIIFNVLLAIAFTKKSIDVA